MTQPYRGVILTINMTTNIMFVHYRKVADKSAIHPERMIQYVYIDNVN